MNILIGTIIIGAIAFYMWQKLPNAEWRAAAYQATWQTMLFAFPRIIVALLGAGFFAELLPVEQVQSLFGEGSGLQGIVLAALLGPITPGGPFVAFAIGAAAFKAGAAAAQILTYTTSWLLFSLMRSISYELPFMGRQATIFRFAICLPVPFIVGFSAQLLY